MSDLDLPLLPSAEQIRRRKFATVKRGYDPDQVHEYLNQVAIQVETLETDLRDERMGASSRAGEAVAAAPPKAASAPRRGRREHGGGLRAAEQAASRPC